MIKIYSFFIFIMILFLYLHIQYEYKINNELEVLSIDLPNKDKLEEICNLKQPTLFKYYNKENGLILEEKYLLDNYHIYDLNVRNIKEEIDKEKYTNLNLKKTFELFDKDKNGKFITENNEDFIKEANINKYFKEYNYMLKSYLTINEKNDLMYGSENSFTPLRYNLNSRNFFYIHDGEIEIKLIAPKYGKYLNEYKDYEDYEFISPINIWDTQPKYVNNLAKIKQLNFTIKNNTILYIPPYWWYSIKYNKKTIVYASYFNTAINIISNIKNIILYYLQNQNINKKTINTINNLNKFIEKEIKKNEKKETKIILNNKNIKIKNKTKK